MIMVTITRIAGIKDKGVLDQVWESYFIMLAAEIGIILFAMTAFRAFFIARQQREVNKANKIPKNATYKSSEKRRLLQIFVTPKLWPSKSRRHLASERHQANEEGDFPMGHLPDIPRAHMTGIRTFIEGHGKEES